MENQLVLKLVPGDQQATGPASYSVQVENPTGQPVPVTLSAQLLRGDCALQFAPDSLTLDAHGQGTAVLTVTPNAPATIRTVHAFTLHAATETEGVQGAYYVGQLVQVPAATPAVPAEVAAAAVFASETVAPEPPAAPQEPTPPTPTPAAAPPDHLLLNLSPATKTAPGNAVYAVQVANPFPKPIQVSLVGYDSSNRVAVSVEPPTLLVAALGQVNAQATVSPLTPLQQNETQRTCNFEIQASIADSTDRQTARGTLIQTPPPKQPVPWLWLAIGAAAVVLALLLFGVALNGRTNNAGLTGLPTNAVITPAQPTIFATPIVVTPEVAVTAVPPTSAALPTGTPIIVVPPTNAAPPTVAPLTAPPAFAITGVVVTVNPPSSNVCPQQFQFTGTISASGSGQAAYQWEFSNGVKTQPVTVPIRDSAQAVVQGNVELAQSAQGWGQLLILSPAQVASNRAALVLTCPAVQPTAAP